MAYHPIKLSAMDATTLEIPLGPLYSRRQIKNGLPNKHDTRHLQRNRDLPEARKW